MPFLSGRYNFVTGQYPFEGETVFKLFDNIARAEFNIPDMVGPSLASLLRGMLLKEPEKRLGIAEIQQHESVSDTVCALLTLYSIHRYMPLMPVYISTSSSTRL